MLKDSLTYEEAGIQTSCEPQMCTFSEECEDISETSITSENHGSTSMESNRLGAAATGTAIRMRRGTLAPSLRWQEKRRDDWKVPERQFLVMPDPIPSAAFLFVSQVTLVG